MQQPKAVAGCAASHNVHVAVSVALDPVAISKEGFQEGANATTKLDQVDDWMGRDLVNKVRGRLRSAGSADGAEARRTKEGNRAPTRAGM